MSAWPEMLLPLLLRAAVVMLLVMLIVRGLIWLLSIRSPAIHRWSSVLVLAQGWIIAPLVISIPWYDPPVTPPAVAPEVTSELSFAEVGGEQVTFAQLPHDEIIDEEPSSATRASITLTDLLPYSWRLLIAVWLLGIVALVAAAALSYLQHCRGATTHRKLEADTAAQWQSLLKQANGPQALPLRLTGATGPMLCLLPHGYEVWVPARFWQRSTRAEQRAILLHELSHYRRGDIWKTWLVYALALPQWFNPAAWWAVRNFQQAGEWLCDLDVARSTERADYLQALLRLVELQPPRTSVAGQCAHAHPLLVRVRRLLSPSLCQDSSMNQLLFAATMFVVALVPLFRLELIARAADPPASLLAVKDRMAELDGKIAKVKEDLEALKGRGAEIKAKIESKVEELNKLAEDPSQLSAELKEKAKTFMGGDEQAQLAVVKDFAKLASEDEQVLALGRAVKDSPHESVRRQGLTSIVGKGEVGYPAIGISFESLTGKDREFLAKELSKQKSDDKLLLFALMAKNADEELLATLLGLELAGNQKLMFIASLAEGRKDDDKFAEQIVNIGDKTAGDDGLVILYAAAKSASNTAATAAVKHAVKRKQDAWPVIAAAYKKEDKDCRAAVVRAAKTLGGEAGDFLVKTALEDTNADLRAAAEEAVK